MIEKIKTLHRNSIKNKDTIGKSLYSTLLGEMELEESRKNKALKEEECIVIVKKFIKNINETLQYANPPVRSFLNMEKELLESLLPKTMSNNDIVSFISHNSDLLHSILAAKTEGQAIGIAMKELKGKADGKDVKKAVEELREIYS